MSARIPPRRLVFAGGGIRAIAHLGACAQLAEAELLKHVKEYCGVSAGAFMAFTLALGYRLSTLQLLCKEFDFGQVRTLHDDDAFEIFTGQGVDPGKNLEKLLRSLLHHRDFSETATFKDLAEREGCRRLRIWASNVNTCKPVEFSQETTPNTRLITALRASMAYPLQFTPVQDPETQHYWVDGGLLHNYPLDLLTEEEQAESWGVAFVQEESTAPPITDFVQYMVQLIASSQIPKQRKNITDFHQNTILIDCRGITSLQFELETSERLQLIDQGKEAVKEFLKRTTVADSKLQRRRSVV